MNFDFQYQDPQDNPNEGRAKSNANFELINSVVSFFNGGIVNEATIFLSNLSGTTYYSGSTPLETIITNLALSADTLYSAITLTSTQVQHLGDTFEILPALIAPYYYDIKEIILEYTEGAVSYDFDNYICIFYGGVRLFNVEAGLINNGENAFVCLHPALPYATAGGIAYASASYFGDTGVFLGTSNSVNPASGDGTLKAKIWYTIRTFG